MRKTKNRNTDIYRTLKDEIAVKNYPDGEILPTDMQYAERFQVSRPTVARAMQRLQREGVVGRKAGYGTYVIKPKTPNVSGKELTLGLLIPALGETEIFEPICGQIANLADAHNFTLLWGGSGTIQNRGVNLAIQQAHKYIAKKVDGVFFTPLELSPEAAKQNRLIISMFAKAGIPVVLLDSDIISSPKMSGYDRIGINNIEAGFVMASHLVEQGCKKIAFVTRRHIASTVHMRLIGAREAILQAGLEHDKMEEIIIEGSEDEFVRGTDLSQFDGLICCNDALAAPLLVELDKIGVSIPEDMKIAAFDDVRYASLIKTPLTSYRQPCVDIGTAAVETMVSRIKHPEMAARAVRVQGNLVVRESTGVSD
ncbi:MAG: substrate-binding domain-containing protein [Akkermansiaceae bacterium]|nr:substrate-binding domain-containing protein [Akkermansiaceae bacterium]